MIYKVQLILKLKIKQGEDRFEKDNLFYLSSIIRNNGVFTSSQIIEG